MRICVGVDVAKTTHWAVGVDEASRVVLDGAVDNNPQAIDGFVAELRGLDGEVVIGLDVVGSFARFLEAMLLAEGFALVHAPGIAVNRAGQGFAGGERKSDPKDARTIAELVRTRDLRPILPDDETRVALALKAGRRRDLIQEQTRRLSRLRNLLCGIHPGLERVLDVTCKGPLALLTRYVTPAEIRRAGQARIVAHLRKTSHLHGIDVLADRALTAAQAQWIAVPGEAATAELIRELAAEALDTRTKMARIDHDLEALLDRHPDGALIRSLPGMGAVLAAEFIACTGDFRRFASADQLASAAGLPPVLRQSGKPTGWRRAFSGDKALKRVFFQSASAPSPQKTRSPRPSMIVSGGRGSTTPKLSSLSPADASPSSGPCSSAVKPSIPTKRPLDLRITRQLHISLQSSATQKQSSSILAPSRQSAARQGASSRNRTARKPASPQQLRIGGRRRVRWIIAVLALAGAGAAGAMSGGIAIR